MFEVDKITGVLFSILPPKEGILIEENPGNLHYYY